ncbi:hypothetical protein CR513_54568, partial [Mucuna pruriens]
MWYFPLIPRLKRLYSSIVTTLHMRWHSDNKRDPALLCHPSDSESWKHFDRLHLELSKDLRNVRLGLCAYGFSPFGQYEKKLLILVGPSNPKHKINVYLQPLIDELCMLWNDGILTYDVPLKQNFMLKVALMWKINDFPAYGMLSGWTTTRRLKCPICMKRTKAFALKHNRKVSYFDCHPQFLPLDHPYRRNKNSFKKMLSYWNTHLLRHNIDVMHTERNVFMNVFDTVMDINDTHKARMGIAKIGNRKELELKDNSCVKLFKPKAAYALTNSQRVKELKLLDRYASNLDGCVDVNQGKLHGMKSHDCHVFMQRLLPIAFDSLPKHIWNPLVELSHFFRELTSTTLNVENLTVME